MKSYAYNAYNEIYVVVKLTTVTKSSPAVQVYSPAIIFKATDYDMKLSRLACEVTSHSLYSE